jgi:hypothetical protein
MKCQKLRIKQAYSTVSLPIRIIAMANLVVAINALNFQLSAPTNPQQFKSQKNEGCLKNMKDG